jgi:hypothetical protein
MITEQQEQQFKNINKSPCVLCGLFYCDCDIKKGIDWGSERSIIAEHNKHLIGLRAKFKNNKDYVKTTWGKEGVIVKNDLTKWLYLRFDIPLKSGYKDSCITRELILRAGSFNLI